LDGVWHARWCPPHLSSCFPSPHPAPEGPEPTPRGCGVDPPPLPAARRWLSGAARAPAIDAPRLDSLSRPLPEAPVHGPRPFACLVQSRRSAPVLSRLGPPRKVRVIVSPFDSKHANVKKKWCKLNYLKKTKKKQKKAIKLKKRKEPKTHSGSSSKTGTEPHFRTRWSWFTGGSLGNRFPLPSPAQDKPVDKWTRTPRPTGRGGGGGGAFAAPGLPTGTFAPVFSAKGSCPSPV